MASAWGLSWGAFWGNSWGLMTPPTPETPVSVPSGGRPQDWSRHPWMRPVGELRKKKQELVAEIPQPVAAAAQEAVEKAIKQRYERQQAIDLASAEQELRAALALLQKEWDEQYQRLLLLEYQIYMQELEEASIAMLLFEM